MRYDSADNYQAGANAVISNLSASHKVRAEDGDDVDVLKMPGELARMRRSPLAASPCRITWHVWYC